MLQTKQQYVYEVIAGIGFGFVLTSLLTLIPVVVEKRDMPIVIGAITQIRVLGGTIGLAISMAILNGFVKGRLSVLLGAEEAALIGQSLQGIEGLTAGQQYAVREIFAKGYRRQMQVLAGFSGCVVVTCALMWERRPRRVFVEESDMGRDGLES